jgi:hypothetical protein
MKTKFLVLAACILAAQAVNAQLAVGIKGGVNMTKVDGRSFADEFRYGYHLGGFVTVNLGSRFGVQPEVLFNQYQTRTGTDFSNTYPNGNNLQNVKLNYLTIPIMLNYRLANVLSLQAGPQFGVLISQDKNLLQNGQEAFKSGEFSMAGGLQFNLSKLRLSGRYIVGLNNIGDVGSTEKWKNQNIQLSAGFAF